MLFNSLAFAVFMTIVFLVYWLIPERFHYLVILAANCYFYLGFGVQNFILLSCVILASYVGARLLEDACGIRKKLCFG
ncbi:MAG: MBOAT family protein, partial [Lachnospiraceae bacterium]